MGTMKRVRPLTPTEREVRRRQGRKRVLSALQSAAARARAKVRPLLTDLPAGVLAENLFKPPKFPPSAMPTDASMAMDESVDITANAQWAQSLYNAAGYQGMVFLGYPYLAELAQRPEYRVLAEVIATEMTRKWIELKSSDTEDDKSEKLKELETELKRLNVQDQFRKIAELDAFFGRAHLYLDTGATDNPNELKMPIGDGATKLSKSKVKQGQFATVRTVEPVWTYPSNYNSNDPLKPDWYYPNAWLVQGKQIHSTRLLTFVGRPVPDLLKPAYAFGGLSMTQMAMPYVQNWLRTRQSVSDAISNFSVRGIKSNMQAGLQDGGEEMFARADLFAAVSDNRNLMMLDKDTEDFFNVQTTLSSLDLLQAQSQEHMAAVSRIPIVKLLGIQPAGLNASSEGEIETFSDWIHAFQMRLFGPALERIIAFAQLSLWGFVDPSISFIFVPLRGKDEKEDAEIEKIRAETDGIYIDKQVVDQEDVRTRIATDRKSQYAGLEVDKLPEITDEEGDDLDPDDDQEQGSEELDDNETDDDDAPAKDVKPKIKRVLAKDADKSVKDKDASKSAHPDHAFYKAGKEAKSKGSGSYPFTATKEQQRAWRQEQQRAWRQGLGGFDADKPYSAEAHAKATDT